MVTYYYDNNKTIYCAERELQVNVAAAASSVQMDLGLANLPDLSGQSTVFVNKIMITAKGYGHIGGVNRGYGTLTCGIVPTDLAAGTMFEGYSSFQDVKGWPLKNGLKYYVVFCNTSPSGSDMNRISLSYTYTPKKALVLNREQSVIANFHNTYGVNCDVLLTIALQLKRAG